LLNETAKFESMNNMLIENSSPFDVDKTVDLIVAEAEKQNWKVPAVHDLQQSLAKSGKIVDPVKVIEICKPELSSQILELNHERAMSVMMPCRISVYQKEDGKTYIALLNAESMVQSLTETVARTMVAASEESLQIVRYALMNS
jgi:uncharacterized protein (DUF302 family)